MAIEVHNKANYDVVTIRSFWSCFVVVFVIVVVIAVVGVIDIDIFPIVVAVYIWFGQKSYLWLLEANIVVFIVVLDVIVDISVVNDVVGVLIVVADHIILNCRQ